MLQLPGKLTAETFLARHWQKKPLFMPAAVERLRPAVTRNELAWLATLDDVESRIVFTDRSGGALRYRATSGPFDPDYLAALPPRDWTLLVHDVEKHLPALRKLFALVPFVPDWRCDDLMISFAAPGGGVGPHLDNYDVFLCQGIGIRDWRVTCADVAPSPEASRDLALLEEFSGTTHRAREGDVLYLPPGVPHWGTAQRACLTYSLGMRAPQLSDLADALPDKELSGTFYCDPDLAPDESQPGWISAQAIARATALLADAGVASADVARSLGEAVTGTKDWLTPQTADESDTRMLLQSLRRSTRLSLHGMARVAFDRRRVFVNGRSHPMPRGAENLVAEVCARRELRGPLPADDAVTQLVAWMLETGAFELPGNL